MIEIPTLYDHQQDFVNRLRSSIAKHRNVIACSPTGSGKSRIAKWIMAAAASKGTKRSLFAVHRRGLVDNIVQRFNETPTLNHGVIMSGCDTSPGCPVQVASIDTLLSWYCEGGEYKTDYTYDLVTFDETHSHFSKLRTFLEAHGKKRQQLGLEPPYVLGLTATPQCKGLSDLYKEIVIGPTPKWLQENGFASKFRYMTGQKGRLDKLKKQGGEFTKTSVDEAMQGLAGNFIRDWKQHAEGRPTIGFFPRLSHAEDALNMLRAAGVEAAYVDGQTPDEERQWLFAKLGVDYEYLCNVGVVERGTDIPAISCVQLCTAIGSRVRYLQMVGRGARIADGKADCLVLDHGDNVRRHGLWEDDQEWFLDHTSKNASENGIRPTIECPKCGEIYRGGECSHCGYKPTQRERKAQKLTFTGSELVEISKVKRTVSDPKQLFIQCLYRAGRSGKTWRQCCGMFKGECRRAGVNHFVPKRFEIGGTVYEAVPFGHPDGSRRVASLFPFTGQ